MLPKLKDIKELGNPISSLRYSLELDLRTTLVRYTGIEEEFNKAINTLCSKVELRNSVRSSGVVRSVKLFLIENELVDIESTLNKLWKLSVPVKLSVVLLKCEGSEARRITFSSNSKNFLYKMVLDSSRSDNVVSTLTFSE